MQNLKTALQLQVFKLRDGTSQCPFSSISKQDLLFLFFQGFIFTFWIFNPSKPDRFRSSRLTCRGSEQNASTRLVLALRRVRVGPRGPSLCLKIRMQSLSTLDAIWCHILHVFWCNGAFRQVPFRALLLSWHLNLFLPNLARPNVFLSINKRMQTVSIWIHLFERPRLLEKVWSRIKATAMMWSMMSLEDQRIWANCLWGLVTWGCLVEVAFVVPDFCPPSVEGVWLWDCVNLESIERSHIPVHKVTRVTFESQMCCFVKKPEASRSSGSECLDSRDKPLHDETMS